MNWDDLCLEDRLIYLLKRERKAFHSGEETAERYGKLAILIELKDRSKPPYLDQNKVIEYNP